MRKLTLALAFTLLTLTGACATTSARAPFALAGSEWRFTTIDGSAATGETMLWFQSDRLAVSVGCNRMGGTWRIADRRLIAGPLMGTKMHCEGKMDQERALSALLEGSPVITLSGNRLKLNSAAHSAELVRDGQPISFGREP